MSKRDRKKHIVVDNDHQDGEQLLHPTEIAGAPEHWDQELWEEGPLEVVSEDDPWVEVNIAEATVVDAVVDEVGAEEASVVEAEISFYRALSSGDDRSPGLGIRPERTFETGPAVVEMRSERTFDGDDDE